MVIGNIFSVDIQHPIFLSFSTTLNVYSIRFDDDDDYCDRNLLVRSAASLAASCTPNHEAGSMESFSNFVVYARLRKLS